MALILFRSILLFQLNGSPVPSGIATTGVKRHVVGKRIWIQCNKNR